MEVHKASLSLPCMPLNFEVSSYDLLHDCRSFDPLSFALPRESVILSLAIGASEVPRSPANHRLVHCEESSFGFPINRIPPRFSRSRRKNGNDNTALRRDGGYYSKLMGDARQHSSEASIPSHLRPQISHHSIQSSNPAPCCEATQVGQLASRFWESRQRGKMVR